MPEEKLFESYEVYDKDWNRFELASGQLYCPGCGTIFTFQPDKVLRDFPIHEMQHCSGHTETGKRCQYEFHAFSDERFAYDFYEEVASTHEKYIFPQRATGKFFVFFAYDATERFLPTSLIDLMPLESLNDRGKMLSSVTKLPLDFILPEGERGRYAGLYESDEALPAACVESREANGRICRTCQTFRPEHVFVQKRMYKPRVCLCPKGRIFLAYPFWMENRYLGMVTAGGFAYHFDDIDKLARQFADDFENDVYCRKAWTVSESRIERLIKQHREEIDALQRDVACEDSMSQKRQEGFLADLQAKCDYLRADTEAFVLREVLLHSLLTADHESYEDIPLEFKNIHFSLAEESNLTVTEIRERFADLQLRIERFSEVVRRLGDSLKQDRDNRFILEIQALFERKYQAVVDLDWCWRRLQEILGRIKAYLGLDLVVLMTNDQREDQFRVRKTSESIDDSKLPQKKVPIGKDIRRFLLDNREIFFPKRLRKDKVYFGNPAKIVEAFSFLGKTMYSDCEPVIALPIAISIRRGDKRWACAILYAREVNDRYDMSRPIYYRLRSSLTQMLRFMEREKFQSEYLARLDHELLRPMVGIEAIRDYLEKKLEWEIIERDLPYSARLLRDNFASIKDFVNAYDWITADFLSRGMLEKMKMEVREFDFFNRIVRTVIRLHGTEIRNKQLKISRLRIESLTSVNSVEPLLFRVFNNIFNNAVKYAYKNTVIELSHKYKNDLLYIHIRNEGITIPSTERQTIFIRGVRGSEAASIDYRGTGQGLAMCATIMERLNGQIGFSYGQDEHDIDFYFAIPQKAV